MGITIAYRGRLTDLSRVEDFEDRLVDFALEVSGQVRIWRTWADDNPARVVRGVILDLAPGQESTSLLLSPEGCLIGLTDIQDAEEGRLEEAPWCFVKTQFGPVEGHVALVEMLAALKREFLPGLEVSDEGGYWETRDLAGLVRKHSLIKQAIDGLVEGLRRHGLSPEAAEDSSIVLRRIERVAAQVHRTLRRQAEHPPVEFGDEDDVSGAAGLDATETQWGKVSTQNTHQQERIQRALGERRSCGLGEGPPSQDARRDVVADLADGDAKERPPLLQKAVDLLERLDSIFHVDGQRSAPPLRTLYQGAGDVIGGLARALSYRDHDADNHGPRVVQLKSALRGAALARGSLFPLRSAMSTEQFDALFRAVEELDTDILTELREVRFEYPSEDR